MESTLRSFDIAHLGHVELLTPKPEESLRFFVDIMGMTESGREGDSVYLRGWDDYEFHTVKLTASKVAGLGHLSPADLGPDALAIMHTATVFQIGGLARWYASLRAAQRPKLFLQFQYPLAFGVRHAAEVPEAISAA